MISRRRFIQQTSVLAMTLPLTRFVSAEGMSKGWLMPDEASPHARTWMTFGANNDIRGQRLLPGVQENLANMALTIAEYEPVSMLVRQNDMARAYALMGDKVDFIESNMNDL